MDTKTVCVTGASGFLGSQVVKTLLERGYNVRGTVRDKDNVNKTQHLTGLPNAKERLTLYNADLLEAGSFDKAFENCDGVFHTASPFFIGGDSSEETLVKPAVEGTLNVLTSANKCDTIKRVVLTSSTASVYADFGARGKDHVYSDDDWSNEELLRERKVWYPLGKTMAERLAFEFVKDEKNNCAFSLVTMNPTYILGEMLAPSRNESSNKIFNYYTGKVDEMTDECKSYVDVRDVALAHVLGFEKEEAFGRHLLLGVSCFESEFGKTMKKVCPDAKLPKVMPVPKGNQSMFGPHQPAKLLYTCAKAEQLGVTFRSLEDMIGSMVESLKTHGFLDEQ